MDWHFCDKEMHMENNLIYEFTKDPAYLNQYYQVREQCYKEYWGLKVFSGAEDEHDRNGYILIVRNGDVVIGGGRLVLRSTNERKKLPMETDDFMLHKVLPGLSSPHTVWGDIGRIAVLPEFRGKKVLKIGFYLLAQAQQDHCNYLTTVAPTKQAKKYKEISEPFGVDIQIIDYLPVADLPYYNNIEMKLLLCDLATVPDALMLLTNFTYVFEKNSTEPDSIK
jgi:hypothetical protein